MTISYGEPEAQMNWMRKRRSMPQVTGNDALAVKQLLWRTLAARVATGDGPHESIGPKPVSGDDTGFIIRFRDGHQMAIMFTDAGRWRG